MILSDLESPKRTILILQDLVIALTGHDFLMKAGFPQLFAWPKSGIILITMTFCTGFRPHACFMKEQNQLHLLGDVENFLAELFAKGYQYQSHNAYRSAVSLMNQWS